MLMSGCTYSRTHFDYIYYSDHNYDYSRREVEDIDKRYEAIGTKALIWSVVALFYGIYMIVAGCKPVRVFSLSVRIQALREFVKLNACNTRAVHVHIQTLKCCCKGQNIFCGALAIAIVALCFDVYICRNLACYTVPRELRRGVCETDDGLMLQATLACLCSRLTEYKLGIRKTTFGRLTHMTSHARKNM
jgi:hypothetical protein